jgi:hypothetical protein
MFHKRCEGLADDLAPLSVRGGLFLDEWPEHIQCAAGPDERSQKRFDLRIGDKIATQLFVVVRAYSHIAGRPRNQQVFKHRGALKRVCGQGKTE